MLTLSSSLTLCCVGVMSGSNAHSDCQIFFVFAVHLLHRYTINVTLLEMVEGPYRLPTEKLRTVSLMCSGHI